MTHTRRQLEKECSRALERYVGTLEKSCDLLGEAEQSMITEHQRDKTLSPCKDEVSAYVAFTTARRRLWGFLRDSEPQVAPRRPLWRVHDILRTRPGHI
jgi:hypothetical protein